MARRRKNLEAAVKQHRMQVNTAAISGVRQGYFANCFAVRRPEVLKRAERRSQANACLRPCTVEIPHILRLQAGLQTVHIDAIDSPTRPDASRNLAFRVERPSLF